MTEHDRAEEQRRIREKRDAEEARRRSLRDARVCASCGKVATDAALALGICPHCGRKLSVVLAQPTLPMPIEPPAPYKAPAPEPEPEPAPAEIDDPNPDPPEPACSPSDSSSTPSSEAPTSKASSSPSPGASSAASSSPRRGSRGRADELPTGDAFLASGYPDYGGPHPALVIDVHPESRRPAPTQVTAAAPRETRAPAERKVTGYAVTKVVMTFHMGAGAFEDLDAGTVVELIEPSARDQKDLDHWERVGRQHVVIRWRGGVALVLGKDIARTDLAAWRAQEDRRKASP